MKKALLLIPILLLFAVFILSAADRAVLKEVKGKVEIKPSGGSWTLARTGIEISSGTTISTGFNSGATLDLGSSEIQVRQLTRISLNKLVEQQGTIKTDIGLKVGRIRAEIKDVEGLKHDFTIRSSVSTASVRGTTLEGEDGEEWSGEGGSYTVTTDTGEEITVTEGETIEVESGEEGGDVVTAVEVLEAATEVVTVVTVLEDPPPPPPPPPPPLPPPPPVPTTTTVTITWQ